jgi:hypothetical protein
VIAGFDCCFIGLIEIPASMESEKSVHDCLLSRFIVAQETMIKTAFCSASLS